MLLCWLFNKHENISVLVCAKFALSISVKYIYISYLFEAIKEHYESYS